MRKGFTLLETVFAASVFGLVIIAVMGSWLLFMYKSNRTYTQSDLDMDVRNVIEYFRTEMRNAARETIMFYPENDPPYKAVGFALASDNDGDGLMDMDASGSNILWRKTVVYHVFEKSPTQMRRTVFNNRNTGATYTDFYQQLGQVADAGDGLGACLPGENAATSVMFENLFTGKLWHAESHFDCYAPEPQTFEKVTFGALPLGPGEHKVSFTVTGKNPHSQGKNIRLDQIQASVSGWPLEAELRPMEGGAAKPQFIGEGLAGWAYGLSADTAANGDSVTLTVVNDMIEECEFIGKGRNVALSNTVVRFDAASTQAGFDKGTYVTKLEGQFAAAWEGGEQTGDGIRSVYYDPTNSVFRIPVMGQWVTKDGFGPVFRLYKSLYNNGLQLRRPMFAVLDTTGSATVPGPDIPKGEMVPLVFYQDGVEKASWAACANQKYVELRPRVTQRIYAKSTLMLSFYASITSYETDRMTAFRMQRAGLPGCWMIRGANTNLVSEPIWSTNSVVVNTLDILPTLESMAVGYAEGGDYVSHPFDTQSDTGAGKAVSWEASMPSGSSLMMQVRSGNMLTSDQFNIADAPDWTSVPTAASADVTSGSVSTNSSTSSLTGRYVQFRAVMQSAASGAYPGDASGFSVKTGPYRSETPSLRRVLIKWDGETKYLDVAANLIKGPDCGMFKVEVDGNPIIRAVSMEIEIFKDVLTQGGVKKERLRSSMMAEVEPRNSTKK